MDEADDFHDCEDYPGDHDGCPYDLEAWQAVSPPVAGPHARGSPRARARSRSRTSNPRGLPATPAARKALTVSALERPVIERADNHAADLRQILNGEPASVEAIVSAQLPAFRAKVFDELTTRYAIVED